MQNSKKQMTLKERIQAPTPKVFIKIRNLSGALAAAGGALLALPIDRPIVNHLAEILLIAGILISIVAQTVTTEATD